jgi:serine/threonine protein kinase
MAMTVAAPAGRSEEGSAMYAYLRAVSGPDQGRIFNLTDGTTLVIGRSEQSDTRLKDATVARLHCELRCQGGEFTLVDLETINGTTIGGQKIQEHLLRHGEEFQIGNTRLKFFSSAVEDTKTLESAQKTSVALKIKPDEGVLTGTVLSHYELGPVLARGETGAVYKARDTRANKDVAVKVLYTDLARDEVRLRRFMRVMKAIVGLHHHNLVALCGAGKHGETLWFAMEYVEGEPLTKVLERLGTQKKISWKYTLAAGAQLARGLEALHEKQVVHRNVAPENILIRSKDKVAKLGDMVLAELKDGSEPPTALPPGELMGSVHYMAPERTRNSPEADIRADIYSLGATLYTMIAGQPPFEGKTITDLVTHIRQDDPISLRRFQDELPEEFQDAVEKMLAKRPEMRYQTPAQAARALERVIKELATLAEPGKSALIRMHGHADEPQGAAGTHPPRR